MKKIPDIINRLWNVCGQMEVGALLTWGSGINNNNNKTAMHKKQTIPLPVLQCFVLSLSSVVGMDVHIEIIRPPRSCPALDSEN